MLQGQKVLNLKKLFSDYSGEKMTGHFFNIVCWPAVI